jgi:hypothetical protein
MLRSRFSLALLSVAVLAPAGLLAQVTGQMNGNIVDPAGAAVGNAAVKIYLSGGSKAVLETTANASGFFTVPSLRPDTYDVEIQAAGFAPARVKGVHVDPARTVTVPPLSLEVSTVSQSVEVSAAANTVQLTSPEISSTLSTEQLGHLPVLDRQITAVLITQPGITGDRTSTSINGLRPSFTNITVDGINVQDSVRTNDLDFQPNRLTIGQIAELTVSTSNVDSTIGGNANNISIVTPSGTNSYHGNAYWYNRNSHFAANDWFNNQSGAARPFLNLNQLGATIGGPVLKDKLFFFSNYEAYRSRATTPRTLTILTPTARQGILQYRSGGAVQQFDVLKAAGVGIDPVIQGLVAQVPAVGNSNTAGDGLNTTGYTFNPRNNRDRDNVTGKLDYYLSPQQIFSVSYLWNREVADRPDNTGSGTFYTLTPPIYNDNANTFMSMSWRWNPLPTLTNELRGGFDRQTGAFVNRAQTPKIYLTGLLFNTPMTQNQPEVRKTNNYSVQDNANWVKGNHNFAFGFQAAPTTTTDVNLGSIYPSFAVGTNTTNGFGFNSGSIPGASSTDISRANSLLVSLAGVLNTGTQTFNPASRTSGYVPGSPSLLALNLNNFAPYFRDSWKIRRNLTLTLGVRWEYFGPVNVVNGLMVQPKVIDGNAPLTLTSNATIDFVPGLLYKRDLNNFAPNLGFAWDPFSNGKTSVRGGYSVSFANDNLINNIPNTIYYGVNNGLSTAQSVGNLKAFASSAPAITPPPFAIPRTSLDNYNTSPGSPPAQGLIDPNLATPYVQQWNLSVQREVKGLVLEARYVGNHTVKQLRVIDYNQIDVSRGGFLQDFLSARNNGFLALNAAGVFNPSYNPAIAGNKPLPFFATLASGGSLTNATVAGLLRTGEPGTLAQTYQTSGFLPAGFSFFPNPYALYSALLTNVSSASYNGAQFEIVKRSKNGMTMQASYTFSKSLSDALAVRGLEAQLDNNNSKIEKARTPFDTTQSFKLNHFIPLPAGAGQRLAAHNAFVNRIAGGWGLGGFLRIESGPPVSILSARGTLNRGARSANNTVDTALTHNQLKDLTGTFKTGSSVYWIDPKYINPVTGQGIAPDGSAPFANQVFFNPQPGSLGSLQRRTLDGPAFWMYDLSLLKNTRITERQSVELRADFYNLFNHPSFFIGDQNVNSATFGQIAAQNYTNYGVGPRLVQFGLMYRF